MGYITTMKRVKTSGYVTSRQEPFMQRYLFSLKEVFQSTRIGEFCNGEGKDASSFVVPAVSEDAQDIFILGEKGHGLP